MKNNTLLKKGNCAEPGFIDLWRREEARTGIIWTDSPEAYHYVVLVCPRRKVTNVALFYHGEKVRKFIGAGVAVRSPLDKYHETAGVRLALSRALHSVNMHRRPR